MRLCSTNSVAKIIYSNQVADPPSTKLVIHSNLQTEAFPCTCAPQEDTVQAKTSRIQRRGRQTSAVPWIPCRTSVSSRSTAGRGATTPTESTGCCPARTHTDAGEVGQTVKNGFTRRVHACVWLWSHCHRGQVWWVVARAWSILSSLRAAVVQQASGQTVKSRWWACGLLPGAHLAALHTFTCIGRATQSGDACRRHVWYLPNARWDTWLWNPCVAFGAAACGAWW